MGQAPPGPSVAGGTPGRRRLFRLGCAAVLGAGGLTALAIGLGYGHESPPAPEALSPAEIAAIEAAALDAQAGLGEDPSLARMPLESLDRAAPVHLTISRVGIDTSIIELGLAPDGTLEVPPDERNSPAGWYGGGPSPGERGPTVIVGHLDAPDSPAVFYNLGALRAGDIARITRADGTVTAFRVSEVGTYPREFFPSNAVYGPSAGSVLRLITCGGAYTKGAGYTHNVVVFADLVGASTAPEVTPTPIPPPPPAPAPAPAAPPTVEPRPAADPGRSVPGPPAQPIPAAPVASPREASKPESAPRPRYVPPPPKPPPPKPKPRPAPPAAEPYDPWAFS
ncbi:MAG: class F sortase [Sporichthyaceae bacterium]